MNQGPCVDNTRLPDPSLVAGAKARPVEYALTSPIFLLGSERSGTTLLRLMLDHHPRIAFNLESEYLVSQIADDGSLPPMAAYRAWLGRDRVFRRSDFTIDARLEYIDLVRDFLRQKMLRDRKELIGATMHRAMAKIPRIWPQARYVYMYRDGRDVAGSVVGMGWSGNVYVAADWWLAAEREWTALRRSIRKDQWIEVRFEDLVTRTRVELARICAFVGVDYSEAMFDYVRTSSYQAPDPHQCARWQSHLRPVDIRRFEARLAEGLTSRGYPLSGAPRVSIGPLYDRYLRLQSRIGSWRFRIRRFGVMLTLQDALLRRLQLRGSYAHVRENLDRITDRHLR